MVKHLDIESEVSLTSRKTMTTLLPRPSDPNRNLIKDSVCSEQSFRSKMKLLKQGLGNTVLIVKKDDKSPGSFILSGIIDEGTQFANLFGEITGLASVNCKNISRINSVGIKLWREFFKEVRAQGVKLKFQELSPALMTTVNYLSDFVGKDEIESFCAPFYCEACEKITLRVFSISQASSFIASAMVAPCDYCKANAEFDEVPDEYFAFLKV